MIQIEQVHRGWRVTIITTERSGFTLVRHTNHAATLIGAFWLAWRHGRRLR